MKKLLILAILALGLCASPAFAGTIDFTKVDDAFLYELNNSYRTDDWYYRWERRLDYKLPGSEAGIRFEFDAWQMEGPWGWDNSGDFYRTADGIRIDLDEHTWVRLEFYSDLANGVKGWSADEFFTTFGIDEELALSIDFIKSDGGYASVSYGYDYSDHSWASDIITNPNDLFTIDFAALCSAGWNGLASDSLIETITVSNYYNGNRSASGRFTLSSITHPSITASSNPVPVPAAVWLLGTGVAGVAALRRKFK